jgi:hypothetical protein
MSSNLGIKDESFPLTSMVLFDNFRENSSPWRKDEKKGIKISSATRSAYRSQKDQKPSRTGSSLPTHLLSKPEYF